MTLVSLFLQPQGGNAMRWKWILIAGVVLVVAVIVAVFVILSSYDFNSLKPPIADAVRDATGRELTMAGDIHLALGLTPALVVEDVGFQNAPWGSRDDLATVKRFEVQIALIPLISKKIEVKRLIMIEPDILIETDKAGNLNFEFEKASDSEKQEEEAPDAGEIALPELALNNVRIEKGRFTYRDGESGEAYAVTLDRLNAAAPGMRSPVKLDLKGTYNGKPFEADGSVGPLAGLTAPGTPWPVELTARAGGATITVDGAIQDVVNIKGIALNVTAEGQSIPEVAGFADITGIPDIGVFKVAGKLNAPSTKAFEFSDFKLTLGESDIGGSLMIALADEPLRLTASLKSKKIDLRPLLSEEKGTEAETATAEPGKKTDKVFPSDPLPLDLLRLAEVKADIQIDQILLPRVAINNLTTEISLKDGGLKVKPIKAVVGGGPLAGHLDLLTRGPVADMDFALKADALDLGRMLKELDITDLLDGNLDSDIALTSAGGSVADLMAGLNGKSIIIMGDGRINNKYVNLVGTDLGSGALKLLNPFEQKKDYTELNCFVSRFDIKDGLAESTALVLDTDGMSVVGDGRIDLNTEKLSISLKPSPKKGLGTSATGKVNLSLGELVKPFKLGGTLANPKLAIDPTQSAITIGKAVGGASLFGPAGIAAALASTGGGGENPCMAAIEAAETGVKVAEPEKAEGEDAAVMKAPEDIGESVQGTVEEAGKALKGLFGQ